ncbi:MAG: DUF2335 domain-containing protein [Spirochaetota bacterium]|nr:DUF2335 domain-containing protein [Spirochaetota bacterium]
MPKVKDNKELKGLSNITLPKELEKLPPKEKKELIQIIQATRWSGPIPSPKDLDEYNKIEKGFADRIIKLTEKEQDHRHNFNFELMKNERYLRVLGLCFAFAIIIILLFSTIYLYYISKNEGIVITLIAEIAVIAGLFIYWSGKGKKEET